MTSTLARGSRWRPAWWHGGGSPVAGTTVTTLDVLRLALTLHSHFVRPASRACATWSHCCPAQGGLPRRRALHRPPPHAGADAILDDRPRRRTGAGVGDWTPKSTRPRPTTIPPGGSVPTPSAMRSSPSCPPPWASVAATVASVTRGRAGRKAVTARTCDAIDRIERVPPRLADHLGNSVQMPARHTEMTGRPYSLARVWEDQPLGRSTSVVPDAGEGPRWVVHHPGSCQSLGSPYACTVVIQWLSRGEAVRNRPAGDRCGRKATVNHYGGSFYARRRTKSYEAPRTLTGKWR